MNGDNVIWNVNEGCSMAMTKLSIQKRGCKIVRRIREAQPQADRGEFPLSTALHSRFDPDRKPEASQQSRTSRTRSRYSLSASCPTG
jgi:hypothetical protein